MWVLYSPCIIFVLYSELVGNRWKTLGGKGVKRGMDGVVRTRLGSR